VAETPEYIFNSPVEFAASVTRILERHDCHEEPVHPKRVEPLWHQGWSPLRVAAHEIMPEDEGQEDWVKAIGACEDCKAKELQIRALSR
jgi:hypothetical protein